MNERLFGQLLWEYVTQLLLQKRAEPTQDLTMRAGDLATTDVLLVVDQVKVRVTDAAAQRAQHDALVWSRRARS